MRYVRLLAVIVLLTSLGITVSRWRAQVNWRPQQVVLVTFDALPADRLASFGASAPVTAPNLEALARQSVVFEQAHAAVPSESSGDPARAASAAFAPSANALATRFRDHGIPTATAWPAPGLAAATPLDGFAAVLGDAGAPEALAAGARDAALTAWLTPHAAQPLFLWVQPPSQPGADPDALVREADALVGRLLIGLAKLGVGEGLLIVVTAARGTSDGRVPLLIGAPKFDPARIAAPVAAGDVFATIADLAALPAPPPLDGRSLVPLLEGDAS